MLRDGLNHVLCRKRRDAIRQRAPEFHRWQSHRRLMRWHKTPWRPTIKIEAPTDQEAVAAIVRDCNRLQLEQLRRLGVLC